MSDVSQLIRPKTLVSRSVPLHREDANAQFEIGVTTTSRLTPAARATTNVGQLVEPVTGYRLVGDPLPSVSGGPSLERAKVASGLNWKEVAVVLGVSRRTIYNWLDGARARGTNALRIAGFYNAVLGELTVTGKDPRTAMLTPGVDGLSPAARIAKHLRSEYPRDRAPVTPWELLQAPTTDEEPPQTGEMTRAIPIANIDW